MLAALQQAQAVNELDFSKNKKREIFMIDKFKTLNAGQLNKYHFYYTLLKINHLKPKI